MSRHSLKVFADYNQFYLWDAGVNPAAPEDYTDEDVRGMVKVAPCVVVVQPVRNMEVPVELLLHEQDPGFEPSNWDHVAECALNLPTGQLQIHECTGQPVLDLLVPHGIYQARVLFAGLSTLSDDGLEGDDRYRIDLWPGPPRELRIIKQWEGAWLTKPSRRPNANTQHLGSHRQVVQGSVSCSAGRSAECPCDGVRIR